MNQSRSIFKQLKHLSFVRRLAIGLFDNGIYNIKRKLPGCDMDLVNYQSPGLYFSAYNQDGFILNSGVKVIGSCAAFPRNAFSWNVNNALDISEESLSLFFILEPPLEVLIIGKGETKVPVNRRRILDICWKHHLPVEVMSTHHAIGTFNFLNSEGRYVAAAIIPPRRLDAYDEADREAKILLLGRESEEYSKHIY
uniref:NADH dehydrogenase [ubiquinone] 1 alpha subcomplex assembly factor 3 n=1 Tax=Schistosoma japonicum TaxID=6182 RepID=Q5DAV2_SCHJA|nr:SJCHGC04800 protein [Schistosoma japonicum]